MTRYHLLPAVAVSVLALACSDGSTAPASTAQLGGPVVSFASVHLKGGANAEPAFTDLILQLQATGALSGLGNGDIYVLMNALANATATCTNPSGGTEPAGVNPAPVAVSGGQFIPASSVDKNGNVPFDVTTAAPANNPRPATHAECPQSGGASSDKLTNWTFTLTDLSFYHADILIYQPASGDPNNPGPLVLTVSCDFSPATSNGAVPAGSVSCTQT